MHTLLIAAAIFSFQNNFWVNLHQFLHAEAVRKATGKAIQMDAALVDEYAALGKKNPVFDTQLVKINDALAQVRGDSLPDSIDPAVAATLKRAAPTYRERFWPGHRAANDRWIAEIQPRVEKMAPALTQKLAAAYRTPWPTRPVLVDVCHDGGPVGAYTTDAGPSGFAGHSTIASSNEDTQRDMGVEIVFHEASHTVDAAIMKAVSDEAGRQGVRATRNLWHAIIFYTAGELVRRELGMVGDSHYMPYAYRYDVYSKGMDKERVALERDWQPWLDGRVTFEDALRALVRDARP
jgi:hypothetical protein